jgi:hypothetical protein
MTEEEKAAMKPWVEKLETGWAYSERNSADGR